MSTPNNRIDIAQITPISGITNPVWTELNDYTDPAVATRYGKDLQVIVNIFQQPTVDSSNNPIPITQADANAVVNALADLKDLAVNGIQTENPPGITQTHFLTRAMATNLDLLIRSFVAIGVTDPASGFTAQQLTQWKDLSIISPVIQNILSRAEGAVSSNTSLQAMLEVQYVDAGNSVVSDQLASLQQALTITNDTLNTLSTLQDLRNRMVINPPAKSFASTIPGGLTGNQISPDTAQQTWAGGTYKSAASAYFNTPIFPSIPSSLLTSIFPFGPSLTVQGQQIFRQLINVQKSILSEISALSQIATPSVFTNVNSLYNRLKTLSSNFHEAFGPNASTLTGAPLASAFRKFLLDNNNPKFKVSGLQPGDMQSNLTFAITAAQGLNSTQSDNVRNFLFVFEEFYKSASDILQRISQIIEKMAQNVSSS